jgi:prevent-host-death family protein
MAVVISRTALARNTREIVDQVRHGQPMIVQSYGEDQIVLLDALDYRLLQSVATYAVNPQADDSDDDMTTTMRRYLADQVSLAKAAELLAMSRYELMDRFERLGIPIRLGHATIEEAREEVSAAQQFVYKLP